MATTFATVQALVGEDFFRTMARAYVARTLPMQPVLAEYGVDFPAFVADHAPARGLAYLPDIARLDWALNAALQAPRGTLLGIADGLRVFPQGAGLVVVPAWGPGRLARRPLGVAERDIDRATDRIDGDRVAVLEQPDRPADRRFRPDMADAEPVRGARKAPSVIRATFSPTPWPTSAPVVDSISRMPGPPRAPSKSTDRYQINRLSK